MKRWRFSSRLVVLLAVLTVLLSNFGVSLANHQSDPALSHIVLSAPGHYGQCIDEVTSDILSITNVQNPVTGEDWRLNGYVHVQYVLGPGMRETVPDGIYLIDQIGDLQLEIFYPPVSKWPVFTNPSTGQTLAEIHVDLSIGVYTPDGFKLGELSLGPGHDWDVFCLNPPGPPPPPPPPPPPDGGIQGCTPGFWKNHKSAWTQTAYSPTQKVGDVFVIPSGLNGFANDTLLGALKYGGGPGATGGAKILLRAAVAALLNASHSNVDYPDDTAKVISDVNAALATMNRDTMLYLATNLDNQNNLGCPISN